MRPEIAECRKVAKKYGVKVIFRRLKGAIAGQADFDNNLIIINSELSSRQEIISTLFHELGHFVAYKKGIWKKYHDGGEDMMKTAVRAEKWIDLWALHEIWTHDKRLRYLGSYTDCNLAEAKKFLEDYYNGE